MKYKAIGLPLLLLAMVAATLPAQNAAPKRTLHGIVAKYRALISKSDRAGDMKASDAAIAAFLVALREYLSHEAKGEERHHTRFELVATLRLAGEESAAKKALAAFDAKDASALTCVSAAQLAMRFGLSGEATAWLTIAIAKPGTFEERMELAVQLMSRLHRPKQAQKIFDAALAAAGTKEKKAEVEWHRARGTRDREDLPEGSYEKALARLAKAYPKTRHGRIARDIRLAMDFHVGGDPLRVQVNTLGGDAFDSHAKRGKPVLLYFWRALDPRSAVAARCVEDLHRSRGGDGLLVVGISVDEKTSEASAGVRRFKTTHPQAHATGGMNSDLALRFRVEDTPHCMLIGRDGKIAGLNFVFFSDTDRGRLSRAVTKALASKAK